MEVQVNWLAVVLAAAASMVVGAVWYARPVFGSKWMKLVKLDEKKASEGAMRAMVLAFVMSFVTAYVLAHVTYLSNSFFGNPFMQDALTTAFWAWLGFTAARFVTHDAFELRDKTITWLTVGHELVTFMAMGLVIGLMKV